MADKSAIEWTDATWNPIAGCTRVSEGCRHCYAERFAARGLPGFEGLANYASRPDGQREARWTGAVTVRKHLMDQPLRWKKPRKIFVNSMSDLFHDAVPDEVIDRVFAVMALCPQHTFQILTKRPERMRQYVSRPRPIASAAIEIGVKHKLNNMHIDRCIDQRIPLPNIWLGTSVDDQKSADERRDHLAVVADAGWNAFASYEPALGYVTWIGWEFLKQLISGGESGPRARPSHPDWHRSARDFCSEHGILYLFKQWGEWTPRRLAEKDDLVNARKSLILSPDGRFTSGLMSYPDTAWIVDRVGKRAAGRLLDGVEHNGMPHLS